MTKAQHTPGPWVYHKQLNGSLTFFGENGNRAILSAARLINQEANACLIAAAPELLAALQEVTMVLDRIFGVEGREPDAESISGRARAAIAKATEGAV